MLRPFCRRTAELRSRREDEPIRPARPAICRARTASCRPGDGIADDPRHGNGMFGTDRRGDPGRRHADHRGGTDPTHDAGDAAPDDHHHRRRDDGATHATTTTAAPTPDGTTTAASAAHSTPASGEQRLPPLVHGVRADGERRRLQWRQRERAGLHRPGQRDRARRLRPRPGQRRGGLRIAGRGRRRGPAEVGDPAGRGRSPGAAGCDRRGARAGRASLILVTRCSQTR